MNNNDGVVIEVNLDDMEESSPDNMEESSSDEKQSTATDISVAPETETKPEEFEAPSVFNVAVVGDNDLAKSVKVLVFGERINIESKNVDELKEFQPVITFICLDVSLTENYLQEDATLIDACKKASKTGSGIVLKTTVSPETLDRVKNAIGPDAWEKVFVYSPEIETNLHGILNCDTELVGVNSDNSETHKSFFENLTLDFRPNRIVGTPSDICLAKMAIVGRRAVMQEYYNQLFEFTADWDKSAYGTIKNMISKIDDKDKMYKIPVWVRSKVVDGEDGTGQGEFENKEAKIFSGVTDKMTLVDEAIKWSNI